MKQKRQRRQRAHMRVRLRVRGTEERPRLSVYKSLRYIYAQVIDDARGVTLACAWSADPAVRGQLTKSASSAEAAKLVGELVAERARERGIQKVVFDRRRARQGFGVLERNFPRRGGGGVPLPPGGQAVSVETTAAEGRNLGQGIRARKRVFRAGRPHQPRDQGGQGG
jgi:large subunit ribosomal protein L18